MWEMFVAFQFLMLASGFLLQFRENRLRVERWQASVTFSGLEVVEKSGSYHGGLRLKARNGALEVRIEGSGRSQKVGTRIVVVVPGPPGFSGVRIRRETATISTREVEIGDEPFDATFSLVGPMRLLFMLLGPEVRELLTGVNSQCDRMGIAGGEIQVDVYDYQVPLVLPPLLDVAGRFAQTVDAAQRLAENAHRDPIPEVRLLNLLLLLREFPGEPRTVEALRRACSDPSPKNRLRAASELGAEGRGVLLELADSVADDDCSAQAVSILEKELPFDHLRGILTGALRRRLHHTAHACLKALGRYGDAEAVSMLVKVMVREEGELAAAAALALGEAGGEAAEPPLIAALQRERIDLRVAAARSLGRIGSAAAVLPLKEAAERSARDLEITRATRQAIAEIQSRLQGASPGQLSLAGHEAGQLSLAQAEAGQLSIAADGAGQLSLSPPQDESS
jgi:HEAT repeat protein